MSALALDIGTYSIKAISGKAGKNPTITKVVEIFNSVGVAVPVDEGSIEKLQQVIDTMLTDNKLDRKDVRLALPETVISTKVIEVPALSDAELASAIGWQAEKHIPIPPEELSLEYQVLFRPQKKDNRPMRVLLIGARKKIIERYITLFNNLGIEPTLLETQLLAVIRSLGFTPEDPTTLIAHFGASSMDLTIMHQGELQFVVSHVNGGQLLTRSLEQTLSLTNDQAEQYKRTYGLEQQHFQGKVAQSLVPALGVLVGEIKKTIQFFTSQHPQDSVKRIVLSGGTASLPGFVQYLAQELGTEVLISAPFAGVRGVVPDSINKPSFSVCVGLMMREV